MHASIHPLNPHNTLIMVGTLGRTLLLLWLPFGALSNRFLLFFVLLPSYSYNRLILEVIFPCCFLNIVLISTLKHPQSIILISFSPVIITEHFSIFSLFLCSCSFLDMEVSAQALHSSPWPLIPWPLYNEWPCTQPSTPRVLPWNFSLS